MNTQRALADLAPPGTRLSRALGGAFSRELDELELRLRSDPGPGPVGCICGDLFAAGGKRLRALAVLIVGAAEGLAPELSLQLAEATELTHGATLLHDDVIDEADTRRGRPAARRRFSNTLSVLGGDFLLLRSLDTINRLEIAALTAAHRRTLDELLGSEVDQHIAQRDGDISIDGYLSIAAGKTGALFAFACAAPALAAGDRQSADRLWRFGRDFGVAFQAADDVRDLLAVDPTKPGSLDLEDGVLSLPLRLAAQGDEALRGDLVAATRRMPSSEQLTNLTHRILATDAVPAALALGEEHIERGNAALARVELELGPLVALGAWLAGELEDMVR